MSNVADQARVLVPAMLGQDAPAAVSVPYFWSDQYDVKIQALGEPEATDTVHIVEDDGRKFLAYYERDGVVVGVVGGGFPGKVMKVRAKIAAGADHRPAGLSFVWRERACLYSTTPSMASIRARSRRSSVVVALPLSPILVSSTAPRIGAAVCRRERAESNHVRTYVRPNCR